MPIKLGIIGLGARAETLLASLAFLQDAATVTAICDFKDERIEKIKGILQRQNAPAPACYHDYHQLLESRDVEAVIAPTSWNSHLKIAGDAMRQGKYVAIEVGGATSLEELWELVRASESTGVSCMMLENCCYAREEMLVNNLVRQGLFGELIYCECGYEHDISDEILDYYEKGLERGIHNQFRNADLYPTHGLGPIAKMLNINRGNRFLTISSFATKARGLQRTAARRGLDLHFNEGDIVTSVIRCANGENITMHHGVSLPRPYSRRCIVQGTKGLWSEDSKGIFIEGISPTEEKLDMAGNPYIVHKWDSVDSLFEKYDHPIWQKYRDDQKGGHGGCDLLTLQAFFDAVERKSATPIDVYDCAAWMSTTVLSEQSISMGGMPVPFPDFTNGSWMFRKFQNESKWSI